MQSPKISSSFAILDVKVGRARLDKIVQGHKRRIPVTITGFITDTHSGDDGVSIEFSVDVAAVKLGEPAPHDCTCIRCQALAVEDIARAKPLAAGNHARAAD